MGIQNFLFLLAALVAGGTWWWTGAIGYAVMAAVLTFGLSAWLLLKLFNRIDLLRYAWGRPERALLELAPWRLLIPRQDYVILRSGLLAQAELFDTAGRLLEDPTLAPDRRAHARFCLSLRQEKWDDAEQALREGLDTAQGPMRTCFLVDLCGLIAEHFPERLEEAFTLYEQAVSGPIVTGTQEVLLGREALLWIMAGHPQLAREILEANLPSLEGRAPGTACLLPEVALMRRRLGWALWALGETQPALEMLLKAQASYADRRWEARLTRDLGAVRDGQPPFPIAPEAVLAAFEERRQEAVRRETWPGAQQATM